jgi:P4 family phage/plasmid primase-like protien
VKRDAGGKHFESFVASIESAGASWFSGDDWFCPTHDDGQRGSLGIRELPDGSILMHCMGGCKNKDILASAGLPYPGAFYPQSAQRYIYHDADGNPVYCVVRYYKDGKKQLLHKVYEPEHEKADAKGFAGYKGCMRGVERVLFRLPRVLDAAKRGARVFVVGGEKDARAILTVWKEVATTNSGGEGQRWSPAYTEALRGCSEVVVIPDLDAKGNSHAAEVYDALSAAGIPVRIALPKVSIKGGDAANHISDGFGPEDLIPISREDITVPVDLKTHIDTDGGNADRFKDMFGTRVRYVQQQKTWLVWDGARWASDGPEARRMIRKVSQEFWDQCQEEYKKADGNEDLMKYWRARKTFARSLDNAGKARSALEMAEALEGLSTYPKDYDTDPMIFNVANGTIDLRTGKLRPHDRTELNRRVSPVEFDPNAECPVFKEFMEKVVPSSGIRKFLCYYTGMSLTGRMDEHIFPVLYGKGRNGKSTFLNAIMSIMGDYGQALPADTLRVKSSGGSIPNDVARLEGARLALASEFPEGTRINEDLLKRLTGGDPVTARFLNQEFFEFYPTAKFILATNHKPEFRGADDGIWRRVRLVPFNETIPDDEVDTGLAEKLFAERSGILNWALKGLAAWLRHGMYIPPEMLSASREYQEESDLIGQFLEEHAVFGEEETAMASVIYSEFQGWMVEQGMKPWSQTAFGRALAGRPGISKDKHPENRRVMYIGIGVRTVSRG